ncbi:MbtH family NRPS accessory protein [Streptomyces olivochromogenes]|nr:MbtH family NRPS accessory protein [Streptomyces olivochromogenes]
MAGNPFEGDSVTCLVPVDDERRHSPWPAGIQGR